MTLNKLNELNPMNRTNVTSKTDLQHIEKNSERIKSEKNMETLFISELLKIFLESLPMSKKSLFQTYAPIINTELSKTLAERGIGIGKFLVQQNSAYKKQESVNEALERYSIKM